MKLQFGLSSYERLRGDLPGLPVVNMTVEQTDSEGVVLQSRPALSDLSADMGSGPVEALFKRDGVLGGVLFGVSGGALYQGSTLIGAIDGDGPVSMAGYQSFLFIAAGGQLWGYDGITLAAIAFPDGAAVAKVIVAASRAVCVRADTGKFYWSDVLETDIGALDFATAENQPDRLLDLIFIDDILLNCGAETIEFWPNTTSPTAPFQPLEGRVIEEGIRATGCVTGIGSTFAWVTNQNEVCLGDENTVLSNIGLQAQTEASTTCRLFNLLIDGVEHLALRLDNETQIWSYKSQTWSRFESYGLTNWVVQCFAAGVFGSAIDGRTMEWVGGYLDLGGVFERRFRGGFPINGGGVNVANVRLRVNVGQTPHLIGDYVDPVVEIRTSRNAGQTWGNWRPASLGAQGEYRAKVEWRALGMASQPAFLAEFRVTDPVPFRVSDVLINEQWGGR